MSVTWPLSENVIRKRKLSNTFGMVRNNGTKAHQGWDLEAPKGTSIFAVGDGSVVAVLGNSASKHGYGLQLLLSFEFNGKIHYASYAHLSQVYVQPEQIVTMHDVVGATGDSGNEFGFADDELHLHFEIRTQRSVHQGLAGRISPMQIYGVCPLHSAIWANHSPERQNTGRGPQP